MKKNLYLLMMLVPLFGWAKSDVNIESASVPTSGEYVHDNVVYKYGINNSFVAYVKAGSDFAAGSPDAEGTVEILPYVVVDGARYLVTTIDGYAFKGNKKIKKVIIPGSVGSIWGEAFAGCTALEEVIILDPEVGMKSEGLTKIKRHGAFEGCTSLKSINLPASLTELGQHNFGGAVFAGCTSLTSIDIPSSVTEIPDVTFKNCSSLQTVRFRGRLGTIWDEAFQGCTSLTSIDLSLGVKEIGTSAFCSCSCLKSVTLPSEGLKSLKDYCFKNCTSLESIRVPACVRNVGYNFCEGCTSMVEAVIEKGSKSWAGGSFFLNCTGLKKTTIGWEGCLPGSTFKGCSSLETVTLEVANEIGDNAFEGCSSLTFITWSKNIKAFGQECFKGCSSLKHISVPENVTMLPKSVFRNCFGLESIALPDGLKAIDEEAFYGCKSLTVLTLPGKLTTVGGTAFAYCDRLESLKFPETLTSLGAGAFYKSASLKLIDLRAATGLTIKDTSRADKSNLVFRGVPEETLILLPGDEVPSKINAGDTFTALTAEGVKMTFKIISTKDMTCQVGDGENCCINSATAGSLTIPSVAEGFRVVTVGSWALYGCSALTELTISEGIERLEDNSIEQCQTLTAIVLPASVNYLSESFGCFGGNLTSITVAAENQVFDSRGNCNAIIETATNTLRCGCRQTVIPSSVTAIGAWSMAGLQLTSISIPGQILSIGKGALRYNLFSEVTIPANVEKIGSLAFESCGNLEQVTILSWDCKIGSGAFSCNPNLKKVNSSVVKPQSLGYDEDGALYDDGYIFCSYYDNTGKAAVNGDATLFVPAGSKSLYESASAWNNFKNIVESGAEPPSTNVFTALTVEGVELTFKVIDQESKTCQVGDREHSAIDEFAEGPVTIPAKVRGYNVTTIASGAFCSKHNITALTIPEGVERIESNSIEYCNGLTSISIPASLTELNEGFGAFGKYLESITVAAGNPIYDSRGNCNAIIETATNTLRAGCLNTVIPKTVKEIGSWSMHNMAITSLDIPESVVSIGDGAFRYCEFKEVAIPVHVEAIGTEAFGGCMNLEKVVSYIRQPFEIGKYTFSNDNDPELYMPCLTDKVTLYVLNGTSELYAATEGWKEFKNIVEFYVDEESAISYEISEEEDKTVAVGNVTMTFIEEAVIPVSVVIDGDEYMVTSISANAFENNTVLETVTIPETITAIGESAFAGCKNLSDIYCYAESPADLTGTVKARTRSGDEVSVASQVFDGVDMKYCTLWVPKGCASAYRNAEGWGEFVHIKEMAMKGDVNDDGSVDEADVNVIASYIIGESSDYFDEKAADVDKSGKVNAADIVVLINLIRNK